MEFIKQNLDPEKNWETIDQLGAGAFVVMFKARQIGTGRLAAVRRIYINEREELEEYAATLDVINSCRHDNIMTLYDSFYWRDMLHVYQELCAGGSVRSLMVKLGRPLTEAQIQCITQQILHALAFIHDKKIACRDLRAAKILLTIDGCVKLALFDASETRAKIRQRQSTIVGQPYWMAPEVYSQSTTAVFYDVAMTDIWSLGITVIEFARMEPPNFNMHPMRAIFAIQKSDAPKLDLPEIWSPALNDFLTKCLQKVPDNRATALQLLQHSLFADVANNAPIKELLNAANVKGNISDDT